ncbi:hypothetical protein DLREEDagrD3_18840 [Denitratisoma sp. agr-D3]
MIPAKKTVANKTVAALSVVLLLAACAGSAPRSNPAVYDLGSVEPVANTGLAAVDVAAPSWLDGRAMQYRQADQPARRQIFSESRWAAPPAELLAAALRRQLAADGGQGCRLRLELDEWIQHFDAQGGSRLQLALRASLLGAKGDVLEHRGFNLEQPAGGNARQGVEAAVVLERQLAQGLAEWSARLGAGPQGVNARCRGGAAAQGMGASVR